MKNYKYQRKEHYEFRSTYSLETNKNHSYIYFMWLALLHATFAK